MRSNMWTNFALGCLLTVPLAIAVCADPPAEETTESKEKPKEVPRVSVDEARKRAKLAHNIYSSTLDVIHHRYFNNDRAIIPARAMEDIFKDISHEEQIQAKWISVNTKAMSIDHEPETKFEKAAAKAIASGKESYELVEGGQYRRAGAISLMNRGCLGCHLGFGGTTTIDRFAGLVISIPVNDEK